MSGLLSSQSARRQMREMSRRQQESYNGRDASVIRFSSNTIDALIPEISRLPSIENEEKLQNEDGTFTFLEDFSAVDGPDL